VYTENGVPKSSLDEQRVREKITEHNQMLQKKYPIYVKKDKENKEEK
jgi:hypothetical protein